MDAREFRLAGWVVQPNLNRFVCGDRCVRVRPRLMDVLCFLAEHRGEVVAKDEIIAAVWVRRFVAESVLSRSVAELRGILGDDAAEPTYIQTIVKRGYRLVAPVEFVAAAAPEAARDGGQAPRSPTAPAEHTCRLCWGHQEIPLANGENLVGRAADSAARIRSLQVSRRHARIVVTRGRAILEDLGSKNGTFLRGMRISHPVERADGDEIRFGRDMVVFRFCRPYGTTVTDEAQ